MLLTADLTLPTHLCKRPDAQTAELKTIEHATPHGITRLNLLEEPATIEQCMPPLACSPPAHVLQM